MRPIRHVCSCAATAIFIGTLLSPVVTSVRGQASGAKSREKPLRVRLQLRASDTAMVGRLLSARADSIVLIRDGFREPTTVGTETIAAIDTSAGDRWGILRGMSGGLALGGGVGVLAASTVQVDTSCGGSYSRSCLRRQDRPLEALANQVGDIVLGFGLGTVVGFVVGVLHSGENWSTARLEGIPVTAPSPEREDVHATTITVVPRRDGLTLRARVAF